MLSLGYRWAETLTPSYSKFLRALGAEGNGQRPVHGLSDFLRCPSTATISAGEAWRSQFSYMSLTLFVCKMNGLDCSSDFLSNPDIL